MGTGKWEVGSGKREMGNAIASKHQSERGPLNIYQLSFPRASLMLPR